MKRDEAYLQDILTAGLAISRFLKGVSKEAFLVNEEKNEAVVRKLEIIGEVARRVSPEVQLQLPDIPWHLLKGMRNILIHDYDDVDLDIVWETAQRDVPQLIGALRRYLDREV